MRPWSWLPHFIEWLRRAPAPPPPDEEAEAEPFALPMAPPVVVAAHVTPPLEEGLPLATPPIELEEGLAVRLVATDDTAAEAVRASQELLDASRQNRRDAAPEAAWIGVGEESATFA